MASITDSKLRKEMPLYRGALKYFPDALHLVAMLSLRADRKHTPDADPSDMSRPQWVKGKSADHEDCLLRHMTDMDVFDPEMGLSHRVHVAWRGLAQLQAAIDEQGIEVFFNPNMLSDATSERTDLGNVPPPAEDNPPVEAYPELAASLEAGIEEYRFRTQDLSRDLKAAAYPHRYSDPDMEGPDVK